MMGMLSIFATKSNITVTWFLPKQDELLQLAESNNKLLDEENQTEVTTNKEAVSSIKEKL